MYHFVKKNKRGFTAIEVVFGVSIAALILVFSTYSIMQFVNTGRDVTNKTQALYLAEEGLELARYIHDDSWSTISGLTQNVPYAFSVTPTTIGVTTTLENIGIFTRTFTVSNVYRNAQDDIVASTTPGSMVDTKAKYVTTNVRWGNPTTTVSLTSIIANIEP